MIYPGGGYVAEYAPAVTVGVGTPAEADVLVLIGADIDTIIARAEVDTIQARPDVETLSPTEDVDAVQIQPDVDEMEP